MKKRFFICVVLCLTLLSGCMQYNDVQDVRLNVSKLPSSGSGNETDQK